MEHSVPRVDIRECIICGAIALAVIASLPILGLLVFALRPVVIVVIVGAFAAGCLLCACSQRFRKWLEAQTEPEIRYRGLRLAADITLHPSHSWARIRDAVVVGIDDLLQAAVGPVEEIELPSVGERVRQGDQLFRLRRGNRSLVIPAPVSGVVLGSNEALREHPELINQRPFGRGWVVRLRGDDLDKDRRRLLRGGRARAWFRREVDRIYEAMPADEGGTAAPAEGEAPAGQLYRRLDDAAWSRLTAAVAATPRTDSEAGR